MEISSRSSARVALLVLLMMMLFGCTLAETQVKYTPNEDNDKPSLPMSMKLRQQLMQLEQAISKSPDPKATLQQVAQSNQMSPDELLKMLQTNAQDLQQDPELMRKVASGGAAKSIPAAIARVVASMGVAVTGLAKKHPQSFSLAVATLVMLLYVMISIPINGMVISRSPKPFLLSSGPTTMVVPPTKYLQRVVESNSMYKRKVSSAVSKSIKTEWDDLDSSADIEEHILITKHKLTRKDELKQAVSAAVALPAGDMLDEFGDDSGDDEQRDYVLDLMYEHAQTLISDLSWTEFADSDSDADTYLRLFPSDDKALAVLVVKGLGDWRRYGITYWKHEDSEESLDRASVTLSSLKGAALDAQLHVSITWPDGADELALRVHLVSPKGARTVSNRMASKITQSIAASLRRSITERARQRLVRASQSGRVHQLAHRRALERRSMRFETLQKMEEMAEDRRRKWQRNNPDAGRYRPSGVRQQSPNNC